LDVEAQVKRGADFRLGRGAPQLLCSLLEHSQVQVDADGVQVAGLLRAQQVSRAAQFEVQRRQAKARAQVGELFERGKPPLGDRRQRVVGRDQEIGVSAAAGAAHPSSQLVKIGQAEALRVVDDQSVGARNVKAVFDEHGRDQQVVFALDELEHHL